MAKKTFLVLLLASKTLLVHAQAVPLAHNGQEGVWLPTDMARDALLATEQRPKFEQRIRLLETELTLKSQQISLYQDADKKGQEARAKLTQSIQKAIDAREAAKSRLNAWYRNPALLVSTGIVVGIVAVVIPMVALR